MSVGKRIIEGAKSGLNSLLDRVAADDTPLTGVEREELDAELERRTADRKAGAPPRPEDNPRARWAGAGEEAARRRREAAEAREQQVKAARAESKRASEAAHEAAWRKIQEEARRTGDGTAGTAGTGTGTGTGTGRAGEGERGRGGGGRGAPGSRGFGRDEKIAKYYKVLDLPYGADFEQVKASYRKLMRRYHPDLHGQSPQKQKAATELTMQVTQAYNEIESYLSKKG